MSTERDTDRLLRQWLDEGPNRAADGLVETVEGRIERQRQRPVWRLTWRDLFMNRTIGAFAAGMAVVAVALIGFTLASGARSPNEVASAPDASGTVAPVVETPAPPMTSSPVAPSMPTSPGPSATSEDSFHFTGTLPEGWGQDGYTFATEGDVSLEILANRSVMATDCVLGPAAGFGTKARDLAQALAGRDGLVVSGLTGANDVGGLSGLRLDLKLADDWTGTCPWWDDGNSPVVPTFGAFDEKNFWLYTAIAKGEQVRMYLLDRSAGGNVLVAFWAPDADAFAANIDAAESIVGGLEFDAGS